MTVPGPTPPASDETERPLVAAREAAGTGGGACANCSAPVVGDYCPHCGQETRIALPPARQFVREAAGRYVALDGRLWRTLFALFFRPGFLTREYFAGRRRRYIRPARLFLVLSLVLFAALRFTVNVTAGIVDVADEGVAKVGVGAKALSDNAKRAAAPAKANGAREKAADRPGEASGTGTPPRPPAERHSGMTIDPDGLLHVDLTDQVPGWLRPRIDAFKALPPDARLDHVVGGVMRFGPYAMALLLPAFALLLQLVYVGRAARHPERPRRYAAHLVFAAHTHAFLFLAIGLMALAGWGPVVAAGVVWVACYLALALKRVYGGSWSGVVFRGAILLGAYASLLSLVLVPWLLAAVVLA